MTNNLSIILIYALLLAFVKAEIQEAEFSPSLRESYKNKTKFTSDRKYCIKLYLHCIKKVFGYLALYGVKLL